MVCSWSHAKTHGLAAFKFAVSVALHLTVAGGLKHTTTDSANSSNCSWGQYKSNFTCLPLVPVGSGAAYSAIFSKWCAFDAQCGLTVGRN